jgi:hypothetical protein
MGSRVIGKPFGSFPGRYVMRSKAAVKSTATLACILRFEVRLHLLCQLTSGAYRLTKLLL